MNSFKHIFGKDWTIIPAGGSTGEAYFAKNNEKSLFLKRNSSPFLAVLSAEGIVPKLVWTKRMENGDVITAQEWLEGRELTPEEMQHPKVAKLLSKIHHSTELLDMLMRIEKTPMEPKDILLDLRKDIKQNLELDSQIDIHRALKYLEEMLPHIKSNTQVVCHCDMNHNNWLLSGDGQLYLIDWDNARVGDPAMDIGTILQWYIPEADWDYWLESYGIEKDLHLIDRMYWYLMTEAISYIIWHSKRSEDKEAAQRLKELKRLVQKVTVC
ncbi:phosphotransferase [Aquibacillus halophilus]|uniref:Phosphotransferase n=1 Tax=Aquibacillus halophilus TaxID=930132 RepID=A0A6A8DB21_9BACI|nr:phosphotransferase [Aquibacillus halophilus]